MAGGGADLDHEADLDYWGAPDAMRTEPEDLGLYPDNWEVVMFFMRLQTQWMVSAMGQRVGLVYSSVTTVAEVFGQKITPEFFHDLQILEIAYINETNRHGNK